MDEEIKLEKNIKHNISVVVDRLVVKAEMNTRLSDSVETALKLAEGLVVVSANGVDATYSDKFACPECGFTLEEMEPRSFSFNSPFGACPECLGLGFKQEFDERLILPDDSKTLHGGAIKLLGFNLGAASWMRMYFDSLALKYGFSCDVPVRELSKSAYNTIMYGNGGEKIDLEYSTKSFHSTYKSAWEGFVNNLQRRYTQTGSVSVKWDIERYMRTCDCPRARANDLKRKLWRSLSAVRT